MSTHRKSMIIGIVIAAIIAVVILISPMTGTAPTP